MEIKKTELLPIVVVLVLLFGGGGFLDMAAGGDLAFFISKSAHGLTARSIGPVRLEPEFTYSVSTAPLPLHLCDQSADHGMRRTLL